MPNKESRQNLMFSATFSKMVRKIASSFMNELLITMNNVFSANDIILYGFSRLIPTMRR